MTIFLSEDYMPTVNLNRPAIEPGQITEADLAAARQNSPGRVHLVPAGCGQYRWPERRVNWQADFPDTVPTDYGAPGWLDSCATEGGKHADPVPSAVLSMRRHDRIRYRVALVLLLALAGYAAHIAWPLLGH